MKCYNHHDRDAMGIDLMTGKGLCLECLEEYKGVIIEKNNLFSRRRADDTTKAYNRIDDSEKQMKIMRMLFISVAIFAFIFFVLSLPTGRIDFISAIMGIVFLIIGLQMKPTKKQ